MTQRAYHRDYVITDDPAWIDVDAVHAFLTGSYWAKGIPREVVRRALANSLCIGIYAPPPTPGDAPGGQVGLVRVVSDYATFAYLCDVYVLEAHRGRGLATAAMRFVANHPRLQGLRRLHLVTQDAHPLYAGHGFKPLARPERHMEKTDPHVYLGAASK